MLMPEALSDLEGVVVYSLTVIALLAMLLIAFPFAYLAQWDKLMTQLAYQKDQVARKEQEMMKKVVIKAEKTKNHLSARMV